MRILRRKLRNCEPYYTMKLMLVGKGGHGKTTLVHRLKDDFTFNENDLTQGRNDMYVCMYVKLYSKTNLLTVRCLQQRTQPEVTKAGF